MKIAGFVCLIALLAVAFADVDVTERCRLKPDPGPCKGAFPRYFFNQKTKKCDVFIWGGCKGVVPFETLEDCQYKCEDPCKQRPDRGPCRAAIESYFFNQKTRKCEKFLWGGCGGSRPFATLNACQKKCGK